MNSPGYISSPPQVEYIVGGVPGEFPWIYIISPSGRIFCRRCTRWIPLDIYHLPLRMISIVFYLKKSWILVISFIVTVMYYYTILILCRPHFIPTWFQLLPLGIQEFNPSPVLEYNPSPHQDPEYSSILHLDLELSPTLLLVLNLHTLIKLRNKKIILYFTDNLSFTLLHKGLSSKDETFITT